MKIALSLFLVTCLICSTVALFWDREAGPPEGVWGKPSNGIQAMIYATRPIVKVGQRCDIHLRLRNSGKRRRVQSSRPYITDKRWMNWRLEAERIGNLKLCDEPSIALEPGQVVDFLYRTRHFERIGAHGYLANVGSVRKGVPEDAFGVRSNKITMYVIPGNGFWIVLIALELAGLYMVMVLRPRNPSADDSAE